LEFIELARNSRGEAADIFNSVESIKANIARTGIPVQSVGRWAAKANVGGKLDPEEIENLTALFDAAVAIGSKVFVLGCNYDKSVSLFKNYIAAIELFGSLLDRAKGKDIQVAAYNCDWENFVYQPSVWEVVLGELPDLKIKFDCSHSYGRRADYLAELSDWGHKVAHMHVKGCVRAGSKGIDDSPAGMDDLKWAQVFAIMYSRKYDGGFSIEPHSATWRADSELGDKGIKFAANYIRQYIL
jgi:sugar phosphate isomerase/epimerase